MISVYVWHLPIILSAMNLIMIGVEKANKKPTTKKILNHVEKFVKVKREYTLLNFDYNCYAIEIFIYN